MNGTCCGASCRRSTPGEWWMPVDYDYIEKESKNLKNRFNEIFQ